MKRGRKMVWLTMVTLLLAAVVILPAQAHAVSTRSKAISAYKNLLNTAISKKTIPETNSKGKTVGYLKLNRGIGKFRIVDLNSDGVPELVLKPSWNTNSNTTCAPKSYNTMLFTYYNKKVYLAGHEYGLDYYKLSKKTKLFLGSGQYHGYTMRGYRILKKGALVTMGMRFRNDMTNEYSYTLKGRDCSKTTLNNYLKKNYGVTLGASYVKASYKKITKSNIKKYCK